MGWLVNITALPFCLRVRLGTYCTGEWGTYCTGEWGGPLYRAKCTFIEDQRLLVPYKKYILFSTDSYWLLYSLQLCYL